MAVAGFTTYITRYVDDKLTVVVLTNLDSGHSNTGKIAHGVAGLLKPGLIPPVARPIKDKEPQVTALLQSTLMKLAEGKAEVTAFTARQWEELSPNLSGIAELLKELGPLQKLELLDRKQEGQERVYSYRATFREPLKIGMRPTAEAKIAELEFDRE